MDNKQGDTGWWTWILIGIGYLVTCVLISVSVAMWTSGEGAPVAPTISLDELAREVKAGNIRSVQVAGQHGVASASADRWYSFRISAGSDLLSVLRAYGVSSDELARVEYIVAEPSPIAGFTQAIASLLPMLFLAILAFLAMRRPSEDVNDQILQFGKSRARRFAFRGTGTRFQDVAGTDEAKQELQEIVEFLRFPRRFAALGARIPRGVLLIGAPGTGKTLLSRAVAGEAGVPFFSIAGSEFVELIVGVGASRVRDLFEEAKRNAPCIVFVDEIDAVGRRRGAGQGSGSDEREQTLNQILVAMDGFDANTGVVVIAATNRPDVLDPALLRPGRFDRQVVLAAPDSNGRRAILEVHARGKPLARDVDLGCVANLTLGLSGADLANLMNEGAILAARRNHATIDMSDLEEAMDRVIAGPEYRSRVLSDADRVLTAYHEGGHAIVMRYTPFHDPVQRITIVPHGEEGGYTRSLPPEDRVYLTRNQLEAMLASALGGHAAERLVYGETSTRAHNDIRHATSLAHDMVERYGMSHHFGPVAVNQTQQPVLLGREIGQQRACAEATAEAIDNEVRQLLDEGYARAVQVITEHRDVLERLTDALLRVETLEGAMLERVFRGEPQRSAEVHHEPAA